MEDDIFISTYVSPERIDRKYLATASGLITYTDFLSIRHITNNTDTKELDVIQLCQQYNAHLYFTQVIRPKKTKELIAICHEALNECSSIYNSRLLISSKLGEIGSFIETTSNVYGLAINESVHQVKYILAVRSNSSSQILDYDGLRSSYLHELCLIDITNEHWEVLVSLLFPWQFRGVSWHPSGEFIYFVQVKIYGEPIISSILCQLHLSTRSITRILTINDYVPLSDPACSPDGNYIAIVYKGIYLLNISTGNFTPVDGLRRHNTTIGALHEGRMTWSPDSQQLLFCAGMGGSNLYTFDLHQGTLGKLTDSGHAYSPSWSEEIELTNSQDNPALS
jgi:hypothetical protein